MSCAVFLATSGVAAQDQETETASPDAETPTRDDSGADEQAPADPESNGESGEPLRDQTTETNEASAEPEEASEAPNETVADDALVDDALVDDAENPAELEVQAEAKVGDPSAASEKSAAGQDAVAGWGDLSEFKATDESPLFQTRLYGFINAYVEKVAKTPYRDAADETAYEVNPYEWDVLNFNVMLQGSVKGRYKYFFNLVGNGAGSNTDDTSIDLRNAWVEMPIINDYLNVRAGKTYRRFGLYNEILDAVPTFIGIEPPELFDKDHLMLTRTTNFMVHGAAATNAFTVNYSATTGNDERNMDTVPLGADLNVEFGTWLKFGSSFYYSGPNARPSRGVGDGSPRGGVLNWMEKDEYTVTGAYVELHPASLILQAAYWNAHHDAVRDPDSVMLLADGSLNQRQRSRFFEGGDPTAGVRTKAVYNVRTFYTRIGYEFSIGTSSTLTPYGQFDYFNNEETIRDKDLGGDNEAGLADNGQFFKYTLGAVIRPIQQVALKLDVSAHQQRFNGETVIYPEGRCSLSYFWEL